MTISGGVFDRGSFFFSTNGSTVHNGSLSISTSKFELVVTMSNPKSIILTGASRGIGLAMARLLLKEGHKVFLVARSGEPLERLKGEFKGQVEYLVADLSDLKVSDLLLNQARCRRAHVLSLNCGHAAGASRS